MTSRYSDGYHSDGYRSQAAAHYRNNRGLSWEGASFANNGYPGYSVQQPWQQEQPLANGYTRPGTSLGNGYARPEFAPNGCWHPQPPPPPAPAPAPPFPSYVATSKPHTNHLPPVAVRRSCLRRSDAVKTPWPSEAHGAATSRHSWDPVRQTTVPHTEYPHYPNGTYPGDPLVRLHRKLPAVPKNKFAHHQSLPDDYSNPYRRESYVSKISSYFKPLGPVKPSSLSLRQSSALNGSPSYMSLMGAQAQCTNFQMPTVSESPSVQQHHSQMNRTDSMVAMNGWIGEHHRTLPQPLASRDYSQRRTLPQPPVSFLSRLVLSTSSQNICRWWCLARAMLHRTGGLTRVALSLTTAASPPASPTFSREPPAGTSTGYDEECWAAVHLSCDRQHARPMLSMLEYDKACIFYGKKCLQFIPWNSLLFKA